MSVNGRPFDGQIGTVDSDHGRTARQFSIGLLACVDSWPSLSACARFGCARTAAPSYDISSAANVRRPQDCWRCVLDRGGHRRCADVGSLQRGFSDSARADRRASMNIVYALSAYPLGALSDRVDRKLRRAHCRRRYPRGRAQSPNCDDRRRSVGSPYGHDARAACGAYRRRSAAKPARDSLRCLQLRERNCSPIGESNRGAPVGSWALCHVHGGRGLYGGRACRNDDVLAQMKCHCKDR